MQLESKAKIWETILPQPSKLGIFRVLDSKGVLKVCFARSVDWTLESPVTYYEFRWERYVAFKVTDETHHVPFCVKTCPPLRKNCTFIVEPSEWMNQLQSVGGLLNHHEPNAKHYAIATMDSWVEVISSYAPEIVLLEKAPEVC